MGVAVPEPVSVGIPGPASVGVVVPEPVSVGIPGPASVGVAVPEPVSVGIPGRLAPANAPQSCRLCLELVGLYLR